MSKAGKKIIAAAEEALSIAKGEKPAAAIWHNGHRYVPEITWQPIESAPKDGTPIIGAFWSIRWADSHRKNDIVRCWWEPEFGAFISSCRQMTLAVGYTFEGGATSQLHSPVIEPITHWMPLRPPALSTLPELDAEMGEGR